jgi:PAS domain S-box-containing protein
LIRVLYIESDRDFRGLLKRRIEKADSSFHLETVINGSEAIAKIEIQYFDCILIGQSQSLNSFELSKTIRGMSNVPIIIYALEDSENLVSRSHDAGADELIIRPSLDHPIDLALRIKILVDRRRSEDLALAISMAGNYAVAVEVEDKIIYVNPPFEQLVFKNSSEIISKSLTSFVSTSEKNNLQKILKSGGESTLTILRQNASNRKCRLKITTTKLQGKEASIAVVEDVTELIERENRLRSLHTLASKILPSRSIEELAKKTLDSIEIEFDSEIISYLIVDGDDLVCVERRWRARGLRMPINSGNTMGRAVREGKPVCVKDFRKEPSLLEDSTPRSGISIPVKQNDNVVAVIDLRSSREDAFTETDIDILTSLSAYIGSVHKIIEDLRLAESSETQYRKLLDAFNDAVFVLDDSNYLYVNKRGADLLGYSDPSEIIGIDIYKHVSPDYRDLVKTRLQARLIGDDIPSNYEIKLVKVDGTTIDIEVDASRIIFEGKPASLTIEKDVTAQKQKQIQHDKRTADLESQIEKRTQELLEAQQFAAAGRMASMVGHDLRSPLQSIKNAAYLVRRQPTRSDEMLNSIESSVDRALAMLEELRHQTRETPLKEEAVDLPAMAMGIIKDTPMSEGIQVDMRLDPSIKVVRLDPLKIRRVIENLVRNALEAMPNGGRLTIETKSEGDYINILITDTGVGIPKENFPNLFKSFYTTKSNGLGLGLAYSQKAIEAHGGTLEVESEVGKGTTFKIHLPFHSGQNQAEAK